MSTILDDIKTIASAVSNDNKVVLASGFVATKDEVEWAENILKNHPRKDIFADIEEVIRTKRSQDDYKAGRVRRCYVNQ